MNDNRIRRLLATAEHPVVPSPQFAAALLDDLKDELRFTPRGRLMTRPRRDLRYSYRSNRISRWTVLLVAAALVVVGLGLLAAVGAFQRPAPEPSRDARSALSYDWIGAPRDVPTLGSSQQTTLTFGDGSVSLAGTDYGSSRMPGSFQIMGSELAITATSPDVCRYGDIGTYEWSLSPGDARLHLEVVGDECVARQAALSGDWFRVACKATNNCFGDVDAGTYPTVNFGPRLDPDLPPMSLFGAMTYTVPEGWAVAGDHATDLRLVPSTAYALEGASGPRDGLMSGIEAWSRPAAHLQSDSCSTDLAPGIDRTPEALTTWLGSLPSLETTTPTAVTIDGHAGFSMDIRIAPSWTRTCGFPQPTVPLFMEGVGATGSLGDSPYVVGLTGPARLRIVILDLGQERTVLILIRADDPTTFDALVQDAMPIVESFRFH